MRETGSIDVMCKRNGKKKREAQGKRQKKVVEVEQNIEKIMKMLKGK